VATLFAMASSCNGIATHRQASKDLPDMKQPGGAFSKATGSGSMFAPSERAPCRCPATRSRPATNMPAGIALAAAPIIRLSWVARWVAGTSRARVGEQGPRKHVQSLNYTLLCKGTLDPTSLGSTRTVLHRSKACTALASRSEHFSPGSGRKNRSCSWERTAAGALADRIASKGASKDMPQTLDSLDMAWPRRSSSKADAGAPRGVG